MIRFYFPIVALTAIMSMVACSGRDPVADGANNAATTAAQENAVVPEVNEVAPASEGNTSSDQPGQALTSSTIPAAMHGRWGLTPGDCTSTRGDAKGLLVVSADQLKFYESVGKPAGVLDISPDSASGDFVFTGEGMTWKKYEALELQGGKLVRTESTPMASFTYARCTG